MGEIITTGYVNEKWNEAGFRKFYEDLFQKTEEERLVDKVNQLEGIVESFKSELCDAKSDRNMNW